MESIGKNIGILCRRLNLYLNHSLEKTDVTPTELMFLGSLCTSEGRTQEEISREFAIDKAAVARTVSALESKGLIIRKSDENDKRARRLYLTDKAVKYNELLSNMQNQWEMQAFKGVEEKDLEVFSKVLGVLVDNIRIM